jgi:tetratricopeptide (TPR) repeat protein
MKPLCFHMARYQLPLSIFALAGVIRALYFLELWMHPEYAWPIIDASSYHNFASTWVETGLRDSTTAWHSALYPLFLSFIYWLVRPSFFVAMAVQAVVGAITAAGLAALARAWWDERTGWIAGAIAALYGPVIFFEQELMSAGLTVTASTLVCWELVRQRPAASIRVGCQIGLLATATALLRPELFVGYIAGLTFQALPWLRSHPRRLATAVLPAISALMIFLACAFAVGQLNKQHTGSLTWLPLNSALNIYIANSDDLCATLGARPGPDYDRLINLPKRAGFTTPDEINRFYYEKLYTETLAHPLGKLRNLAWKAAVLVNAREVSLDIDPYTAHLYASTLKLLLWKAIGFGFPFGILLPLAVGGLAMGKQPAARRLLPMLLIIALLLIVLSPASRYRLMLIPPLILFAAHGAAYWWDQRRSIRPKHALVVTGLVLLQTVPGLFCIETHDFTAERFRLIGQQTRDPEQAREWLMAARLRDATDPRTHFFLGFHSWSMGNREAALAELDQALAIAPDYAMALMLKSDILADSNQHESSRQALQAAIASQPDLIDAQIRLAASFAREGLFDQALETIGAATALKPYHRGALATSASIQIDAGFPEPALATLEELLIDEPNAVELRVHAALAAQAAGDSIKARHHALEASTLAPDNIQVRYVMEQLEMNQRMSSDNAE